MAPLAFLSHSHLDQPIANEIASILGTFGFSGFLAHRDLESGTEWREEILQKLREASLLIAVVSPNFAESEWADQEVGFALARGIPVLPVSAGKAPYGFLGHIQGVPWGDEAREGNQWDATDRHWTRAQQVERQARFGVALIHRGVMNRSDIVEKLSASSSWDGTSVLLSVIGDLSALSRTETMAVARAAASNNEVYNCFTARRSLPPFLESRRQLFDPGLQSQLVRVHMLATAATPGTAQEPEPEWGPDPTEGPPGESDGPR
jgi:hypothetical protein